MSKYRITEADFKLFVALWNQRQNLSTPDIHFRIAAWLEHSWISGDKRLLLMAFRSSGKSTLVGLFAAWLLYRNPDLRILVLAADHALAKKMVRNAKRIIERHPLTGHLKPDKADQWASDRFTVRRNLVLRDPSVLAKGIGANITGSRADMVICDDVEVPNTCDSAEKRRDLRERLGEISYILPDGQGTQLYVGTPHSYYTIYADQPRLEIAEEQPFLDSFRRLEIPLLNGEDESVWPERFSNAEIALMKRQSGPNKFASQMLLRPVNIADGRLDPSRLQFYDGGLHYTKELDQLHINGQVMVSASAWWDPAFGGGGGDSSVLAVVYTDENGEYFLHRMEYLSIDSHDDTDEATQQCRQVAEMAQMLRLPHIAVEINGIGKMLPNILRRELKELGQPCTVKEVSSHRSKDIRILEALDAVLVARMLHVHEDVRKTPFLNEMREWRPGASRCRDDGLDALAGALSLEPLRTAPSFPVRGAQSWMKGAGSHRANTEFDV